MSVSTGLSKDTVDNIVWLPSGDVDSPFLDQDPGIKCFIPPQKTPHTDLNESDDTSFTSSSPSSVLQIGIGIPQKRERDKFQSLALDSQFPNLPVPVDFGFQLMVLFSSTMRSLALVTLMNQESSG